MLQRISSVGKLNVSAAILSSVIHLGDCSKICSYSRAIAVQREAEAYIGNEGDFNEYPIFSMPIPLPLIDEPITSVTFNQQPLIKVGSIHVTGISSSSGVHIGSACDITLEARIKHIRQLDESLHPEPYPKKGRS